VSLIVLQGRPYLNFINSLKSQETKQAYQKALLRYLTHYKTTIDSILTLPIAEIENMLIDYLMDQKNQDLSSTYINLNFCAIKHFYFMNDVRINKEKIGKFLGESKKKHTDRGYTTPEIKSIFDLCDLRLKVVVLTLASTSIRIGALTPLKLSNIEKKEKYGVYKFTICENTNDESICFCSPECATYINAYFDYRTRAGERLNPHSPFIREQFDVNDIEQVRKQGRSISKDTLSNMLLSIVTKAGLRKINHNFTGRERKSVPLNHGYRKWWMGQAVSANMNPEIREMLMGHSIGLASSYYRPTEDVMLEEYMKAVDNLTINEENRLRKKVEKLEVEKNQFEQLAAEIREIKKVINSD
jgi:integrase